MKWGNARMRCATAATTITVALMTAHGQAQTGKTGLDPYIEGNLQQVDELEECTIEEGGNERDRAKARMAKALCVYNGRLSKRKIEKTEKEIEQRNKRYFEAVKNLKTATRALAKTFAEIDETKLGGKEPDSKFMSTIDAEFGRLTYRIAWGETGAATRDPSRLGSRKRGKKEKIADMERHKRWAKTAMETEGTNEATSNLGGKGAERERVLKEAGLGRRAANANEDAWQSITSQARERAQATEAIKPEDRASAVTQRAIVERMPTGNDGFTGRYDGYDVEKSERKASLAVLGYVRSSQEVSNKVFCAFHGQAPSPGCVQIWNSDECRVLECNWGVPYPGMTLVNGNPDKKTGGGWLRIFKRERLLACRATEAGQNKMIERPQWLRPRCNQAVETARDLRAERGGRKPHWRTDDRGNLGQELRFEKIVEMTPAKDELEEALKEIEHAKASAEERCTAELIRKCDGVDGPPAILPDAWRSCEIEEKHNVCTAQGVCNEESIMPRCMREAIKTKGCEQAIMKNAENPEQRAIRCSDPRRIAMTNAARENRGIDQQRIAGLEARDRESVKAQAFLIAQQNPQGTSQSGSSTTTNNAGTKPQGKPSKKVGKNFEETKACATALAHACPSVNRDTLWDGLDPWNRCPARVRKNSGTPQTECQARVLESDSACKTIGRRWQVRAECWPKEEER